MMISNCEKLLSSNEFVIKERFSIIQINMFELYKVFKLKVLVKSRLFLNKCTLKKNYLKLFIFYK